MPKSLISASLFAKVKKELTQVPYRFIRAIPHIFWLKHYDLIGKSNASAADIPVMAKIYLLLAMLVVEGIECLSVDLTEDKLYLKELFHEAHEKIQLADDAALIVIRKQFLTIRNDGNEIYLPTTLNKMANVFMDSFNISGIMLSVILLIHFIFQEFDDAEINYASIVISCLTLPMVVYEYKNNNKQINEMDKSLSQIGSEIKSIDDALYIHTPAVRRSFSDNDSTIPRASNSAPPLTQTRAMLFTPERDGEEKKLMPYSNMSFRRLG
ncbi:MAG: hypothetical protein P4M12_12345 [Gammaproteobacteria bacterium]|nr:hypothetical protein [Gammaproteobacteria bacterium]